MPCVNDEKVNEPKAYHPAMTDAQKLAAIDAVLYDLAELQAHLTKTGQEDGLEGAEASAARRIAEIVGFDLPAVRSGLEKL
jgi:hypothetical protein